MLKKYRVVAVRRNGEFVSRRGRIDVELQVVGVEGRSDSTAACLIRTPGGGR